MTAPKMTSGMPKAEQVAAFAVQHGWSPEYKRDLKNDVTVLKLRRYEAKAGNDHPAEIDQIGEFVEIRWDGNSCKEMPTVGHEGQLRYVRNVAAAKRVLESTPEANAEPFTKRTEAKQGLRKAAPVKRAPGKTSRLPFNAETSSDDDIKAALLGHKLVWRNSISGEYEEDTILRSRNYNGLYYVSQSGDRRQISFVGAYGFRSVKLSNVAAVR